MTAVRLQKLLAAAGAGSRRECETFITDGRVHVDGQLVTELGTKVDPDTQEVKLDGERLSMPKRRTWLLNKPRGVICSARGRPDMPMVGDFAPPEARGDRLFTVGRLDVESEGAILLTNDGELCHRVSHPSFGVEKTYRVYVRGVPSDETLEKMRKGVWLAEGRTGPLQIRCLERRREKAVLEIRVREGMKREIRRVCARFGHEVQRLVRVAIGPVQLGKLVAGDTRALTAEEEKGLRECADVIIRLGSKQPVRRGTAASRRGLAKDPDAVGRSQKGPRGAGRGKRGGVSGGRGAASGRRGQSASGGRRFGKGGGKGGRGTSGGR
jgi:23S rRNA pseudouridine2605 synthase